MDTMCVDATTARSATTVADARENTRAFLQGLRPPAGQEAADAVVLVVSELVTNALRHGGGTYTLTAHPSLIEVTVEDPSPRPPRLRNGDCPLGGNVGGWVPGPGRCHRGERGEQPCQGRCSLAPGRLYGTPHRLFAANPPAPRRRSSASAWATPISAFTRTSPCPPQGLPG